MENQTHNEVICILDQSGSMSALQEETVSGLNTFLSEHQRQAALCRFTLVLFNDHYTIPILRQPIEEVQPLTANSYRPQGYTALLDAVGITLENARSQYLALPLSARPSRILVLIMTDGAENASRRYSKERVRALIRELQDSGNWAFQFYGANIDAFAEGENLGLHKDQVQSWLSDKEGIAKVMAHMSLESIRFNQNKG